MKEFLAEDYILQLFSLSLKDKNTLEILRTYLKEEYLPEDSYKELWKSILVEYKFSKNGKPPTIPVLVQQFRKNHDVLEHLSVIKETHIPDPDSVLRNLETFLKQNMFVDYYNTIGDLYNKGSKESAYMYFSKYATEFTQFSLMNKTFDRVYKDFEKRSFNREIEKIDGAKRIRIPTGIDELDYYIKGFETGELVIIMGDSGSGKSFAGNHLGINASRRGYNVYHAQAEGTKEQVLNRYDAAFTGTRYHDVKMNDFGTDAKQRKIQSVINNIGGEIYVHAFELFDAATITDVRNDIIELKKNCEIHYVIVDYLDLFDPGDGKKYDANIERFRQQKVSRMLKNLAVEMNVVVVTFTQASSIPPSELNDPNFVITRYNISEDKGKIRPADLFITINKTKDEKDEQICRLYVDKAREHAGGQIIFIKHNLERARFYDRKKTLNEFFEV